MEDGGNGRMRKMEEWRMRKTDEWRMEGMEGRIKEKRGGRACNKDQDQEIN